MSIGTCINYCVDLSKKIRYAGLETDDQYWCGAEGEQYDQYGLRGDDVACKTIYIAKLYVLHRKSTVPFVLACVYVRFGTNKMFTDS